LATLPQETLDKVRAAFRSPDGQWVGVSGRARVIVYNTDRLNPTMLPASILDYTQRQWRNRVGIVPRSDGFPEFVTALRLVKGQDFAKQWLEALQGNNARTYPNNLSAIQAVANGEIDVAFLNHYYLYRFLAEQGEGFKARNYYFENGDLGGIFLVAGAAVLNTSKHKTEAVRFIDYLLSPKAQQYFADQTHEYPLVEGVTADPNLPPLSTLQTPEIDLSDLTDLKGSLDLMRQTGILP
jgi:iron(III) transport system substrate-binding protein